jgi:hypothetical protein
MKVASKSLQEPSHPLTQDPRFSVFYDETTKEKIARHLTDINDRISEDDIRNINTNITSSASLEYSKSKG